MIDQKNDCEDDQRSHTENVKRHIAAHFWEFHYLRFCFLAFFWSLRLCKVFSSGRGLVTSRAFILVFLSRGLKS